MPMSDGELEFAILKKYIEKFELIGENNPYKCARELDMREVLGKLQVMTTRI